MSIIKEQIQSNYNDIEQSMWALEQWLDKEDAEHVVERIIDMCLTRLEETMLLLEEIEPKLQKNYLEQLSHLKQWIVQMQFSASSFMEMEIYDTKKPS
jgi:hypothetical protein